VSRAGLWVAVVLGSTQQVAGAARKDTASYFGQAPPESTPVVFAPGIISLEGRYEQYLSFAPNGDELVFGVTNSDWSDFSIHYMRKKAEGWSAPEAAPFMGDSPDGLTSCFTFDGRSAFFTSARPAYPPVDIWRTDRTNDGWTSPVKLGPPVSSDADEFEVTVVRDGTLYFSSRREGGLGDLDIYRARLIGGRYPEVENLGAPVNTEHGDDLPYVAPDQSYIIFASNRPGGFGERDLYISFDRDGAWGEAVNLGPEINSAYFDIYPTISPDGRYLFLTRRKAWVTGEDTDILWVRADFIERVRGRAGAGSSAAGTRRAALRP
jgi:WD40-like Beta Propeller Repeat